MGLRDRFKSAGMFPDVGRIQSEMNEKFDKLYAVLVEIRDELRRQGGQAGQIAMGVVIAVVIIILAFVGLLSVCGDEDESLGRQVVASHDYEGDPCWDYGDCGGGYDERNGGSGDGRGGDGRFGGGRSGDYDGGPGDDCRNACGNTIIVPMPGEGGQR